ncbi:hypothetical protein [uncultured Idiomarina sp.]
MDAHIVACCINPFNVLNSHPCNFTAVFNRNMIGVLVCRYITTFR